MPELSGFRISSWDTALRVNAHRSPGRFNRTGSPATQYISLHPLTPWAEYVRYHELTTPEEVAERRLRLYTIRVITEDISTLDFENASSFGLKPGDLVADDWTACQELADRLRDDDAAPKVLNVPSAALAGTRNIVILGERVAIPYLWTPVDDGDLPASVVAEHARPPEKLLELTRMRPEPHAELEAWSSGRRFEFEDLATQPR